jgi:exonuclease SbcC
LNKKREEFISKINDEKTKISEHNNHLPDIGKKVDDLGQQIAELAFDEPAMGKPEEFDDGLLLETTRKLEGIQISSVRDLLVKAQEASIRIDGMTKQIADKIMLLDKETSEMETLKKQADYEASEKLNKAQAELENLTEQYTTINADIARNETIIENTKKTLAEIKEKEHQLLDIGKVIEDAKAEAADWEVISKAFGKDGIQALELDALAPGIFDTANRILASAYGDRFRIEIKTTRMGGTGKKTKQIEDFLIYVIDSEDGEAVLLDDKSGGEAVWIKRAIYDAFAIIRKRNTDFAFLTCFQDETDGALDSAAKTAYCRMLEAAHAESKLRHTVIITHSDEVKAMIDQKINMEELEAAA